MQNALTILARTHWAGASWGPLRSRPPIAPRHRCRADPILACNHSHTRGPPVAKEFINPNWHVILIHYPLGVFVLGMVIELFSFMYRRSTLRVAGRWMILLGALLALPAALSGVYALANVVRMELPAAQVNPDQTWQQVVDMTQFGKDEPEQWEFLRQHVWAQSAATALCAALVTVALGCSDRWRRRL